MNVMGSLRAVAAALALAAALCSNASAQERDAPRWHGYLVIGGSVSSLQSRGETDLFLPFWQTGDDMLFLNFRGQYFVGGNEGNFGVGYRRFVLGGDWILGANLFYDRRYSNETDNAFSQIGLGLEMLSVDWDVRLNGYIPVGGAQRADAFAEARLAADTILIFGGEEHPLYGLDGEIGWRVPLFYEEAPVQLRVYAGGFHFNHSAVDNVTGPRMRAELRLHDIPLLGDGSRITVFGSWQTDDVRGDVGRGGVLVRIPLGTVASAATGIARRPIRNGPMDRRMVDQVVRDIDIVTGGAATGTVEPAINPHHGRIIRRARVLTDTGNLDTDAAALGVDSVAIIDDAGTFNNGSAVVAQTGQALLGGGSSIPVVGAITGVRLIFTAPGSRPTLRNNTGVVVGLADDSQIIGLDIRGANANVAGNHGIGGPGGVDNVEIRGNDIRRTGRSGIIFAGDSSRILITSNTLRNIGTIGVRFIGDADDVGVNNNDIRNTGNEGIEFFADAFFTRVTNNQIRNIGGEGIDFEGELIRGDVSSNFIRNTGEEGIDFGLVALTRVTGNTIRNTGEEGIEFDGPVFLARVDGNDLRLINGDGIRFDDIAARVAVTNNRVRITNGSGIDFEDVLFRANVSGNDIRFAAEEGMDFGAVALARITNNTVRTTGEDGIEFDGPVALLNVSGNTIGRVGLTSGILNSNGIIFQDVALFVRLDNNTFFGQIQGFDMVFLGPSLAFGTGNVHNVNAGNRLCFGGPTAGTITFDTGTCP